MLQHILGEFSSNIGFHFSELLNRPFVKPYWVFVSLSHKCNFNCRMCGVKNILKKHELDLDTVKKVLLDVSGWGNDCVVVFTGGEPFLRKDIFEIIDYSVSLKLKVEVVTNGSLINNQAIAQRIIGSGLKNIAISLDGVDPATHDYIRGSNGAHKEAIEALNFLCQEKRSRGSGPQVSIWTTVMRENIAQLYDMIFLAKELGVECLVYHPVIVAQDDMQSTFKGGSLWPAKSEIARLREQIDKISSYQRENGLVAFLHDPYLWLKYFQGTLDKQDWKCNPFVFVDIGPDGNLRSCGPSFGNVRDAGLSACLQTDAADKARQRMKECPKPCLQTCWARPEADNLLEAVKEFNSKIKSAKGEKKDKLAAIMCGFKLLEEYEKILPEAQGRWKTGSAN